MAWWVQQEGFLGDAVNKISNPLTPQSVDVTWHVTEGATKPNATAHGPYATQALANAEAVSLNESQAPSVVTQAAKSGAGPIGSTVAFLNDLTKRQTLQRLAEGALGVALIIVGVAKLADGTAIGSTLKKVPFV
jgi:hypothetical protein